VPQLIINGRAIHVFDEHDVAKIPWELAGVNYVVEATEALSKAADAKLHLKTTQVEIEFARNLGPMFCFFNIFSPKNLTKKWRFLLKLLLVFAKIVIITLVF
jgi:hypothetical protein